MAFGGHDFGAAVRFLNQWLVESRREGAFIMPVYHKIPSILPRHRGFSLSEMAVVLGIIGLVLGGIVRLITPIQSQNRLNQAVDQIGIITSNVRNSYNGKTLPTGLAACPTSFASANVMPASAGWTLAQQKSFGIFPTETLYISGGIAYVNNPWHVGLPTSTVQIDLCGSNPALFAIRYATLDEKDCGNLVIRESSLGAGMKLYQIIVTSTGSPGVATTFATRMGSADTKVDSATGTANLSDVATACTGGVSSVDFYYGLNS